MPAKLQLDIGYVQELSMKRDLALIAETIVAIIAH